MLRGSARVDDGVLARGAARVARLEPAALASLLVGIKVHPRLGEGEDEGEGEGEFGGEVRMRAR